MIYSRWGDKVITDLKLTDLPQVDFLRKKIILKKASRIIFTLIGRRGVTLSEQLILGWGTIELFSETNFYRSGTIKTELWDNDNPDPLLGTTNAK